MFLFLDFTTDMSLTLIGRYFFLSKKIKSSKNISEILIIEIEMMEKLVGQDGWVKDHM